MLEALRVRDFRLLWAGGVVSSLGSWLLTIAIPAHILLVTGSLRATGLTIAAEYLPLLVLGPLAGVVSDRRDRRWLMITSSLGCAGAVTLMLAGLAPGRYWVLYAALIAENTGIVLYAPAAQALRPAIVGTGSKLSGANALSSLSSGAVRLIGGPLGGVLLIAAGVRWLICADALSYVLAAGSLLLMSPTAGRAVPGDAVPAAAVPGEADPGGEAGTAATLRGVARDLAEGVRVLRAQPVARALLPATLVFLAANASLSAILIAFGVRRLGGSEHTGYLLSCLGVGFLIGAPLIRVLLDRVQPRYLLAAALAGTAAACFLLFTSSSLTGALPAAVAEGMFGSMSLVASQTAMQRVIPNAALGRVGSVFLTGEAAVTLLGAVAGPFLAQAIGLTGTATVAALVTLAASALAILLIPPAPTLTRTAPAVGQQPG